MNVACVHLSLLFALLLPGCLTTQDRGEALYPVTGARPPEGQVARLGGYVRQVDGQQVTEGNAFELLPGCHVVGTPARWGRVDSGGTGGVLVDTGHLTFALLMKPGHKYLIEVEVQMMGGSMGSALVKSVEVDATGKRTGVFGPASSTADIEVCKAAGARLTQ